MSRRRDSSDMDVDSEVSTSEVAGNGNSVTASIAEAGSAVLSGADDDGEGAGEEAHVGDEGGAEAHEGTSYRDLAPALDASVLRAASSGGGDGFTDDDAEGAGGAGAMPIPQDIGYKIIAYNINDPEYKKLKDDLGGGGGGALARSHALAFASPSFPALARTASMGGVSESDVADEDYDGSIAPLNKPGEELFEPRGTGHVPGARSLRFGSEGATAAPAPAPSSQSTATTLLAEDAGEGDGLAPAAPEADLRNNTGEHGDTEPTLADSAAAAVSDVASVPGVVDESLSAAPTHAPAPTPEAEPAPAAAPEAAPAPAPADSDVVLTLSGEGTVEGENA